MGKRVQRKWDLLLGEGSILVSLCVLFLAGGLLGCLFSGMADSQGAENLQTYLTDYLGLVRDGTVGREFVSSVWRQGRDVLLILILSVTAVGIVGIPAVLCVRGFLLAFSIGCFCRVFGTVGLLPGMILFGLPALLWGPALFLISFRGMEHVHQVIRCGSGEVHLPAGFWVHVGISALLLLLCAAAECMVIPELLRAAACVVL